MDDAASGPRPLPNEEAFVTSKKPPTPWLVFSACMRTH